MHNGFVNFYVVRRVVEYNLHVVRELRVAQRFLVYAVVRCSGLWAWNVRLRTSRAQRTPAPGISLTSLKTHGRIESTYISCRPCVISRAYLGCACVWTVSDRIDTWTASIPHESVINKHHRLIIRIFLNIFFFNISIRCSIEIHTYNKTIF